MAEHGCGREACLCCGSDAWTEARFRRGQGIICEPCWQEIERSRRKGNPAQQSLPGTDPTISQPE
jgi:hypothetical protein